MGIAAPSFKPLIMSRLPSVQVTCHRCGNTWTYMGSKVWLIGVARRPVKVACTRCRASTPLVREHAG
jgi:hypothetical protein